MVIFDTGGHIHEAWFLGTCFSVDRDNNEFDVHYYNRHNRSANVRRQQWHPCWKLNGGRGPEVFQEQPPMGSRPVVATIRRDELLSAGFQLNNRGRTIPARILRELHDSDRTEWQLQAA